MSLPVLTTYMLLEHVDKVARTHRRKVTEEARGAFELQAPRFIDRLQMLAPGVPFDVEVTALVTLDGSIILTWDGHGGDLSLEVLHCGCARIYDGVTPR